jgi:hypothetical protein
MNKYKVKITHVFSEVVDIEAENEDQARERATTEIQKDNRNSKPHYETTLPSEHWPVITEEKYNEMVENFKKEVEQEESNIITP